MRITAALIVLAGWLWLVADINDTCDGNDRCAQQTEGLR